MRNETKEMRQARHDLQLLSAGDPSASANMLRHVAAYSLMITGRRGRERRGDEPQVVAGFVLTHGDHQLPAAAVRRSGVGTIYLAFDVDDAASPPVAAGVFRKEDDHVVVSGNCRLWSHANDGRALFVPMGDGGAEEYLVFRTGRSGTSVLASPATSGPVSAARRRGWAASSPPTRCAKCTARATCTGSTTWDRTCTGR